MSVRCLRDNGADRALGEQWEEHFCRLAAWYGKAFHAYQIQRSGAARWQKGSRPALLPDIQIFTDGGEYHEVKHKNATQPRRFQRRYGWESYRLRALHTFREEVQRPVLYTIHDWEAAGAKTADVDMPNVLQDWWSADIQDLVAAAHGLTPELIDTWLGGQRDRVPGYYWPTTLWQRLDLSWGLPE